MLEIGLQRECASEEGSQVIDEIPQENYCEKHQPVRGSSTRVSTKEHIEYNRVNPTSASGNNNQDSVASAARNNRICE